MMKKRHVNYIKLSKSWKNKPYSLLSNVGGVSAGGAETTPTRGKASASISTVKYRSLSNSQLLCKLSQPGNMHLRDKSIAS